LRKEQAITAVWIVAPILATAAVQLAATSAAWLLRAREDALRRQLPYIVSLAVGVLLATALLHLLPEAIEQLGNRRLTWGLAGAAMIALFAAERLFFVISGTGAEPEVGEPCAEHHHQHTPQGARPGALILASMLHSFVDGAAVAVAFLASPRIGWLTALAIALHEIPHRMGDFALLVHLKVPLPKALRLTVLAGMPSFLGLAAVLIAGMRSSAVIAWLLPISAGSFLYIATVNLLPELARESRLSRVLLQIACLCAGAGLVMAVGGLGG
jgi:zinc and cadmium transporter